MLVLGPGLGELEPNLAESFPTPDLPKDPPVAGGHVGHRLLGPVGLAGRVEGTTVALRVVSNLTQLDGNPQ